MRLSAIVGPIDVLKESKRSVDWNGFMEVRDNPLSKVGIFPYLGSEIPGAPDPDKVYQVYRPAEELSSLEAIESFKNKPFIDDHEILGINGIPAERKGIQGNIGEKVYFDAPYLRGNIVIHSTAAQSLIESGKVELSPCYGCDWVEESGTYEGKPYQYVQRNLRANHLALVDEGRTGPDVAVQDSRTFSLDSAELLPMEFTPEQLAQIKAMIAEMVGTPTAGDEDPVKESTDADPVAEDAEVDPVTGEPVAQAVTAEQGSAAEEAVSAAEAAQEAIAEVSAAIEEVAAASEEVVAAADSKKRAAAMDKLTKAKGKLSTAKAKSTRLAADAKAKQQLAKDGALAAQVAKLTKELEAIKRTPAKDSATFLGEVADRDQLAARVSHFTGAFDSSRMTSSQVAAYAVDKLGIKCVKGTESIALDAWLQGRKPEHETVHATDSKVGDALAQWGKK